MSGFGSILWEREPDSRAQDLDEPSFRAGTAPRIGQAAQPGTLQTTGEGASVQALEAAGLAPDDQDVPA